MVTEDEQARRRRMGHRIRQARTNLKLSQEALRDLVQGDLNGETVGQSMISRYETGRAVPEAPKRRALEKHLRLPAGELQRILEPEADEAAIREQVKRDIELLASADDRLAALELDVAGLRDDFQDLSRAVYRALERLVPEASEGT